MYIKDESLIYDNKVSKLKANLTNNEIVKEKLIIKDKFITSNGKILIEIIIVVVKFSANVIKDIDITIYMDVLNARYIVYEVVKQKKKSLILTSSGSMSIVREKLIKKIKIH